MRSWLRTGRLLASLGWEIGPPLLLTYVGVNVIAFLSPLLLALGLRPLVNGVQSRSGTSVLVGAVLIGTALLLTISAPVAYRWATVRMRERSVMVVQRRLLTLASTAPHIEHFERPDFRDRLQLLKDSSSDLVAGMSVVFIGPVVVAQIATTGTLLARLAPVLLLVPLIAIPATLLSQTGERVRRAADLRAAEANRTAQDLFGLASSAAPGKDIRMYGLREQLVDDHRRASHRTHRITEGALLRSVAIDAGTWLLFGAAYAGAALLVLWQATRRNGTAGDVALTLGLATAMVAGAGRLTDLGGSVLRVQTASQHYHWLSDQAAPRPAGSVVAAPQRLTRGITLDDVTFRYGATDSPALSGVSLRLAAGSVVAVVGENGAGKTTLVKLLCGMYRPSSGRILLDDTDLSTADLVGYRKRITAGFQDFMRFEFPLRESVGMGDLPHLTDEDRVRQALKRANATFVDRLPRGLETQLGQAWPGGVELSGGEWQKVALARSMMRDRPLLSILDEPTAALDPQTEHMLFEEVAAAARAGVEDGRITLVISHRFSTVRMADFIVVLQHGAVLEAGTHDELMAAGGLYAELYDLQAKAYR
ncbi:MAG: ATP-binding cassette, subfamily bacterial [Micromonosporaceae bacterium]